MLRDLFTVISIFLGETDRIINVRFENEVKMKGLPYFIHLDWNRCSMMTMLFNFNIFINFGSLQIEINNNTKSHCRSLSEFLDVNGPS